MNETIRKLWPELEWIQDPDLREKTAQVWEYALERSVLTVEDLHRIPFTLLSEKAVNFMAHKRSVVHVCRECARIMQEFYGDALPIDMDILDLGGDPHRRRQAPRVRQGGGQAGHEQGGEARAAPFSGAALAHRFDLPPEVVHMIAGHSKEGDLGPRTTEGWIVHHADFMTFEPFRSLK